VSTMNAMSSRMPLIDALKGMAAQIIVLHHLASYGPLAEALEELAPDLHEWLYGYGRIVVQIFLVVAGFLAARALAPYGLPNVANPVALAWRRYLRLVPPFLVAMVFAIVAAALARHWLQDDAIPAHPGLWQFVAHALLLHGLLDVPALSAGVWYVAIDLQLFALLALLLWLADLAGAGERIRRRAALVLVALLGAAALFHFNLDPELDNWGIYFFASYALGVLAYWCSSRSKALLWLVLVAAVTIAALMIDYRLRIAVALAVALLLAYARNTGVLQRWPDWPVAAYLGRISYSVFLVHFPVCLLVNAAYFRYADDSAAHALLAMLLAWAASTAIGTLFFHQVESRKRWWPAAAAPALP
jgi:peptidoglycan/LPS O-acetylase OafA/YrhL